MRNFGLVLIGIEGKLKKLIARALEAPAAPTAALLSAGTTLPNGR